MWRSSLELALIRFLVILLIFSGASQADEGIVIPQEIRIAYAAMELTEAQMLRFDAQMLHTIDEIKSMIKRESLKNIWPMERRIRNKARSVLKRNLSELIALLKDSQVEQFDQYTDLVLDTLTTHAPGRYKTRPFDPALGITQEDRRTP